MNARELSIAVVHAGLSEESATRVLALRLNDATAALIKSLAREANTEVSVNITKISLRELAVDIANNLVVGFAPPKLAEAKRAVARADALILAAPVFTAGISGLAKSFLDALDPDSLRGTPVLLAATGGTSRHSLVIDYSMRPILAYLGAVTSPTGVFAATEDWGADGEAGGKLGNRIERAALEFASLVARLTGFWVSGARRSTRNDGKLKASTAAPDSPDWVSDSYHSRDEAGYGVDVTSTPNTTTEHRVEGRDEFDDLMRRYT